MSRTTRTSVSPGARISVGTLARAHEDINNRGNGDGARCSIADIGTHNAHARRTVNVADGQIIFDYHNHGAAHPVGILYYYNLYYTGNIL